MTNGTSSDDAPSDPEITKNIDDDNIDSVPVVKDEDRGIDDEKANKKRLERLEQNRISARESRKRKKTMIEELQRSVITLSRENKDINQRNENLRRQLMDIAAKFPAAVPNIQSIMMMGPNTIGQGMPAPLGCGGAPGTAMDIQVQAQAAAAAQAHQTAAAAQQAVSNQNDQDKKNEVNNMNAPQQVVGTVALNGMNMAMMGAHPMAAAYGMAPGLQPQAIAPQQLQAMAWQQQQFNQAMAAMQQAQQQQQQQQVAAQPQHDVPQPQQITTQPQTADTTV
mmetsp:Transcript_40588/g.47487  ORF Transcript_40588/g.47487 Transcript_40588/m.47487 type:complete len:280 (+) Transcript_40588:164-1003(+)|eukprot:CAMPEP_0194362662 /NCGR_PEP_ID=MMETSP0174-20130528/10449_1 /TAXON_ID=216777 /ORGANISM="Proboscia alata, Strain PI-D3" /LENGTH=279 /DNA_ID=CAMNT_0039135667 /DNA_START=142 /DNA_END=981 /DNA_ORIENTATION=-